MTAPTEDLIARIETEVRAWETTRAEDFTPLPFEPLLTEAAQALRALQQEVERLRGALQYYAGGQVSPNEGLWGVNSNDFGDIARSALTGSAQG